MSALTYESLCDIMIENEWMQVGFLRKITEKAEDIMRQISTFYDHIRAVSEQEGVTVAEAMQRVRALGVTALEVSGFNLKDRVREVAEELAAGGLAVASVPVFMDLGRNDDVRGQCEPYFEATRELGADRVLVIPGFFSPEDDESERERVTERMKDGVNRVSEIAKEYGISLIMEDFDNLLSPINSADGLRAFLDACPSLGCCFDTGNFRITGGDELAAYDLLRDRVRYVHLKDRKFAHGIDSKHIPTCTDGTQLLPCAVGSGDIRMSELAGRLKADGYEGGVAIEFYGASPMLDTIARSAEWVRENF